MTADIINLKRARKAKARKDKAEAAAVTRAAFGRSKAEQEASDAEAQRTRHVLDGAKLSPAANQGSFPSTAGHDDDDDLDPGNVS